MKRIKGAIMSSVLIIGLTGGPSAFAQNEFEVDFYTTSVYQIVSTSGGTCSGDIIQEKTCKFPLSQINQVRMQLSVNVSGTSYNCFFTGGTTPQGKPYFTGNCPSQVGTVHVANTPMADSTQPFVVNLP